VYDGKDVIAKARTGTGKTLSFALPLIETLNKNPITTPGRTPRVLVMAPTRELARQVCADFEIVAPHLKSLCVYGGAPYETQRECVCVCVCVLAHPSLVAIVRFGCLFCFVPFACGNGLYFSPHLELIEPF
jgi:Rad3-related DNA helicase